MKDIPNQPQDQVHEQVGYSWCYAHLMGRTAVGVRTSKHGAVPNGGSTADCDVTDEGGIGSDECVLRDTWYLIEKVHQRAMPAHCEEPRERRKKRAFRIRVTGSKHARST